MTGPTRHDSAATRDHLRRTRQQDIGAEVARSLLAPPRSAAAERLAGYAGIDRYGIVALAVPDPRSPHPATDDALVADRIRAELLFGGPGALPAQWGPDHATILVPGIGRHSRYPDELLSQLSDAADRALTATVVSAAPGQVPPAADLAHELLEVAVRLNFPPGAYRWEDLALQYHLTRPGPAFDRLSTLLDPLASHPHLLDTLGHHLDTGFQARRTARRLGLHVLTVRHRLERTHQLIGLDPSLPEDSWLLRSALMVRKYRLAAARPYGDH
ncbi:PucR family transcriptional regulator [Nocardia sp. NPDC003963]